MEQHILFFDIDGTILDEQTGVVPESTKVAIQTARENGHILMLNTGRCKTIWPKKILDLGFHGAVGGCGTYVEYMGKELFHHVLASELCREIINDLIRFHIDGVLEGKDYSYFRKDIFLPQVKRIFGNKGLYDSTLRNWDEENPSFDKMALWHDETSDMEAFRRKYEVWFDFIMRDPTFFEVVPKGFSKATGMKVLIEKLGIPWERTIAVGDSANDISMFEYAARSIGLKSDKEYVLKLVTYVTDTVMNDGVYKGLKEFGII